MKKIFISLLLLVVSFVSITFAIYDVSWSASSYQSGAIATYTFNLTPTYTDYPDMRILFPEGFVYTGNDLYTDIRVTSGGGAEFIPFDINFTAPANFNGIWLNPEFGFSYQDVPYVITIANIINPSAGIYSWASDLELNGEGPQSATLSDITITSSGPQTHLDWCITNSGALALNPWPGNITYEQCAGLAQLYEDTDGDNWNNNDGWFTSTDICSRDRIYCDMDGMQLQLNANGLSGNITDMSGLGSMLSFYLGNNNILSAELGSIGFTYLHLRGTQISSIDLSNVTNPGDVLDLRFFNSNLESLDIAAFTSLNTLYVYNANLSSLIASHPSSYVNGVLLGDGNTDFSGNHLCESNLNADTIAFLDAMDPDWRDGQTGCEEMPEGVLAYSGDAVTPPGFVRIVDDINNPQWMVYMRQYPIGADSENPYGNQSYDYTDMLNYVPASGEAIPSTALKDLLVTSNGSTTWVADGTMYDIGNRSDWVSDPVDAGDGNRHLMSVGGRAQDAIYFEAFSANTNWENKIRTIYTTYYTPVPPVDPFERCMTNSGSINIPYQECIGLAYLYTETDGANWAENDGWFDDLDIRNWETDYCYTPEDEILDRIGFDRCDDSYDFFDADGFERAVVLTGAGPIYNVYAINLSDNGLQGAIQSGMIYFPELRIIDIQDSNGITAIDVTQNPLLEIMDISDEDDSNLRTLDLSNNPLLWALNVDDLYLESIDLSNNTGLIYIDIDGNELTGFDTSGLMYLEYLDLNSNEIESFTSYAPNLTYLDIDGNGLIDVNVENSPLITYLDLSDNNIESVDVSDLTNLVELDLGRNNVSSLDISNNTNLDALYVQGNQLYEIIAATPGNYQNFDSINVDYNGLCNIGGSNVYNLLNSYANEYWLSTQYFCPIRDLTASDVDDDVTLSWSSPQADGSNSEENSTNVIRYTIAWTPGDGSGVIYLGAYNEELEEYDWGSNEQHGWTYTIEDLTDAEEYTITVCAIHANEGPERTVCSTINATPGVDEETPRSSGGGGSIGADSCPNGDNSGSYYDGKCDGVIGERPEVKLPKLTINQIDKKDPIEFCRYNDTKGISAAFIDVVGTPYAPAVTVLVSHCLVQGYGNNGKEFGITNPLTRGELYKVFTRMALLDFDLNTPGLGWSHGYKVAGETVGLWNLLNMDKDQSAIVTQQELLQVTMNYLAYMKVLSEVPTFTFGNKQVTRGEFARFINVVLGLVSTK